MLAAEGFSSVDLYALNELLRETRAETLRLAIVIVKEFPLAICESNRNLSRRVNHDGVSLEFLIVALITAVESDSGV